jgi:hypothetical protein
MDASDLIKSMQRQSCKEGAVHICGPDADRRAKLLIYQAMEGAILDAYLHLDKDVPISRPVQRTGVIGLRAILDGLHHRYVRV